MLYTAIAFVIIVLTFTLLSLKESYAFYFLVFIATFSQSMPILSMGTRSINLGMDTLVIGCMCAWFFLKKPGIFCSLIFSIDNMSLILLLWAVWNVISVIMASLIYLHLNQSVECFVVLLRWLQYVPIFFIISKLDWEEVQTKRFLLFLAFTALVASILGIYEFFTEFNVRTFKGVGSFTRPLFREKNIEDFIDPDSGAYKGEANYNVVGAYLVLVISILLPFILSKKKMSGYILLAILVATNIVTFSRISNIASTIIILIGLLVYSKKQLFGAMLLSVPIIAIFLTHIMNFRLVSSIVEVILHIWEVAPLVLNGQQWTLDSPYGAGVYGAAQRLVGIQESINVFLESPIWGCGYNGFKFLDLKMFTADNYYMQTLAETGIVGFFLMILFHVSLFRLLLKKKYFPSSRGNNFLPFFRIGCFLMLISMILVNFTSGIFYIQKVWGPYLIVAALLVNYKNHFNKNDYFKSNSCKSTGFLTMSLHDHARIK